MDSGRTLGEEIRARTGRTARALPSALRFNRAKAGEIPFGPEDIIRTEIIDVLKHGSLDDDQLYLDQKVATGTGVNPFSRIGRIKNPKKMRDFITFYDLSDEYYLGQMNGKFNSKLGGTYQAPAADKDDINYAYTSPAPLSEVPTSTTNPKRPRTVAAGYVIEENETKGKLTVVFRDGTYYNYYNVTPDEWETFKGRQSKGQYILEALNGKQRGPASDANIDPVIRQELYRISRAVQQVAKGRKMNKRERETQVKGASNSYANPKPVDSYRTKKARNR